MPFQLIDGETEILAQSKDAYRVSAESGACGAMLRGVFERAFFLSKELRAANVVPQSKLDDDQAAYDVARAALAQAQATLEAAQSRIGEARGRLDQSAPVNQAIAVAQANARLAHARQKSVDASLALARLQLSYTRVVAQEDGQVTRLTAREGQMVQPGQTFMMIVPLQSYVIANFKETQLARIQAGDEAEVSIDALGGKTFRGKVEHGMYDH